MNIHTIKQPLSYHDIPNWASQSAKTVLLIRHSIRESLVGEGGLDPHLTPEGVQLAEQCGKILSSLHDITFYSSPRLRCIETAEALIRGGNFRIKEIIPCEQANDLSMLLNPETVMKAIRKKTVMQLLQKYYETGSVENVIPKDEFAHILFQFLTETDFRTNITGVVTHDILIAALLSSYDVYPFKVNDWLWFLHAAVLFQGQNGDWSIGYAMPDVSKREKYQLFV